MVVESDALGVLAVDDYARTHVNRLCDAAVAYGHAIEVPSLVEAQNAMFNSLVAILQHCLTVVKANGEAQRTIVEELV